MRDHTRQRLIWGWLRLILAMLQIGVAGAALGSLLAGGLNSATFILALLASTAAATSRLLYHGRSRQGLNRWRND